MFVCTSQFVSSKVIALKALEGQKVCRGARFFLLPDSRPLGSLGGNMETSFLSFMKK